MAKNVYECDFCSKEFKEYSSQSTQYCSRDCHNKDRRDRIEKSCKVCDNTFETVPSDDCETCSLECGAKIISEKLSNEKIDCKNPKCDNTFSPRKGQKFCCYDCSIGNRSIDGRTWVSLTCVECGNDYKVKPSKYDSSRFCSRECKSDWQEENNLGKDNPNWNSVEKTCTMCDSIFTVWKSREEEAKFCSKDCSAEYKSKFIKGENHPRYSKIDKKCESCGETFKVYESTFERRKCCSKECLAKFRAKNWHGENHPNWKKDGGNRYYGSSWRKNRNKAFNRDNGKCVICSRGKEEIGREPHVHHIKPLRCFENKSQGNCLDNLVTLCPKHHGMVEGWGLAPANILKG